MLETPFGLFWSPAFNGQNPLIAAAAEYLNDSSPVNDTVTTGTADWCSCHLTPFSLRVLNTDVLGVNVYQ